MYFKIYPLTDSLPIGPEMYHAIRNRVEQNHPHPNIFYFIAGEFRMYK